MASSGITIDSSLLDCYKDMKLGKGDPIQLLVMQLSDDKKKVVRKEELCLESCCHADLLEFFGAESMKNNCCYCVHDYKKNNKNKLILIKWAPDTAPATKKMVFASTFSAVKTALDIQKVIEASDLDDLAESEFQKFL